MNSLESKLLRRYLLRDSLSTYDPYDIWKDGLGLRVKVLFNKNRLAATVPAVFFTLYDNFVNNEKRHFYKQQEFPVVRALAASALLNLYSHNREDLLLERAKVNLDWLIHNSCTGYSGYCWGANMRWASKNGLYDANMPFVTNTPYVLEALIRYYQITDFNGYNEIIKSVYSFIFGDLHKRIISENVVAFSYAPFEEERLVVNANSYVLYSLSLLLPFLPRKVDVLREAILQVFNFVVDSQNADGSWWYYGDDVESGNFIDCFHSCFILKNLIKTRKSSLFLPSNVEDVIKKGYEYILSNFYDQKVGLFKRFTRTDKFSIVKYDLYDNAEMLNLFYLLGEMDKYHQLNERIRATFIVENDIYSVIDVFGYKRNKNMLRWAAMPYLYGLSNVFY